MYLYLLLNGIFTLGMFFFFRRYIRQELGKLRYIRHVEKELQSLVLEVHRSAEEVTQVFEDRTAELGRLLQRYEGFQEEWKVLAEGVHLENLGIQQNQQRMRDLKQDAGEAALQLQRLSEQVRGECTGFREQLEAELETRIEERLAERLAVSLELGAKREVGLRSELAQRIEEQAEERKPEGQASQEVQIEAQGLELRTDGQAQETPSHALHPQLRAEIEGYIEMGLDSRIISQKTGVSLGLIEVMLGVKGYTQD